MHRHGFALFARFNHAVNRLDGRATVLGLCMRLWNHNRVTKQTSGKSIVPFLRWETHQSQTAIENLVWINLCALLSTIPILQYKLVIVNGMAVENYLGGAPHHLRAGKVSIHAVSSNHMLCLIQIHILNGIDV